MVVVWSVRVAVLRMKVISCLRWVLGLTVTVPQAEVTNMRGGEVSFLVIIRVAVKGADGFYDGTSELVLDSNSGV